MKIYTGNGDQGETTLLNKQRVRKSDLRVECCGTLDELSAHLGLLRALLAPSPLPATVAADEPPAPPPQLTVHHSQFTTTRSATPPLLEQLQRQLFRLGGVIAAVDSETCQHYHLQPLQQSEVTALEQVIDELAVSLPPLNHFILPGGDLAVAQAHVCRTVCRRAERRLVDLLTTESIPGGASATAWLNRLSDYLFLLSRHLGSRHPIAEQPWQ